MHQSDAVAEGYKYYILNKPYDMVSQFVSPDNVRMLGSINFDWPPGIHAIGRLDNNSEGLLIMTTNKRVTKLLFQGETPHWRTYLVQVKNVVSPESLHILRTGVPIIVQNNETYITPPCEVHIVEKPEGLFESGNRPKEYGAYSWLTISLTEGKFHQVRKMTEAVGHRVRRLIRISIEDLQLGDLQPGCVREIEEEQFFELLKIKNWRTPPGYAPRPKGSHIKN